MKVLRSPWSGVTGHQFEEEFLGTCRVVWNGDYVPFAQALEMVRKNQPTDALHELGRKLHAETVRQLGVGVEAVKFFTALDTPLDKYHSVDCFAEFNGIVVTIDLTMSAKRCYKAAVVVCQEDVDNGLFLAAERIVNAFNWTKNRPSLSCRNS